MKLAMDPYLNWFCGENIVDEPNASYPNAVILPSDDECFINILSAIPHALFLLVSASTLIFLYCCRINNNTGSAHIQKLPYNTFRWLLLMIYLFLCTCSIVEGVLTDLAYQDISTTQPHLYVPQCFVLLAVLCSLVYFHHCEVWQSPRLAWISLFYWIFAEVVEIIKVANYSEVVFHDGDTHLLSIFRLDMAIVSIFVYLIMVVLESTVVFAEVSSHLHEKADMNFYEDYVNPLSFALFSWIDWLLKLGYNTPLEMEHLGSLPLKHTTKHNYERFRDQFKKELNDTAASTGRSPSLWRVYIKTYWHQALITLINKIIPDFLTISVPLVIDVIVKNIEKREQGHIPQTIPHHLTVSEFLQNTYFLAVCFSLLRIAQNLFLQPHNYQCSVVGVQLRSAMQALIYEKSLRLSNLAGSSLTIGEITNHMSTDAMNLLYCAQKMWFIWVAPLRLPVVMGLLYYYIGGLSALLAILSIFLLLPLQAIIVKHSSKHQKEALIHSDERLKRSSEMLNGIKLLKLYGWEDIHLNMLKAVRAKELRAILKFNSQSAFAISLCFALPVVLNVVIFGTYPYLSRKDLTPSVSFTAFVLIILVVDQLYQMLLALTNLVNAVVATRLLEKFFLATEIEDHAPDGEMTFHKSPMDMADADKSQKQKGFSWRRGWKLFSSKDSQSNEFSETLPLTMTSFETYGGEDDIHDSSESYSHADNSDEIAIRICNGSFSWGRENTKPNLKNINVEIPTGHLVMIVGAVSCGKSSLLSAILGEMSTLNGFVKFKKHNTSIAYTAQRPWVINASLRDNILFGKPYQYAKYQRVIDACALKPDIDILPAGDLTEIGEKGINLSGGQKQRVSVARAMYSEKETVLMDNPLSALDAHVGDHLFIKGIKGMVKENRTVILVTHQLQHSKHADLILLVKNGEIVDRGNSDEIMSRNTDMFHGLNMDKNMTSDSDALSESDNDEERRQLKQRVILKSKAVGNGKLSGKGKGDDGNNMIGEIIEAEELERGGISYDVYLFLFKSMGWPIITVFLICRILNEFANIGRSFWLAWWTQSDMTLATDSDTRYYVVGYTLISVGLLIFTILMAFASVIAFHLGSKRIHLAMVDNIFNSPIRFFDTTPVGRILNRFSVDTQLIDIKLYNTWFGLMYYLISLPATLLAIGSVTPIFLVEIIPCCFVYYYYQMYFIRSSRELQRLESTTRSPVYAHFSETLGGLSTIRAYGEQERYFNLLLDKIDTNNKAFLYLQAGYGWIGARLNFLSGAILLMISLTAVISVETSGLSSSHVGLSLAYGTTIAYMIYNIVLSSAQTEIQMNAVERIRHYTQLNNEDHSGREPPASWPYNGGIQIDDIYVRYADDLPPVLTGVSLDVRPGEKVGVCGRTGSGKSSLTLTLFRLINTFQGSIFIDGQDISRLSLKTLRRLLSIIPQDPILFSGSIRNNLDPEDKKTDSELWEALETAQLKGMVSKFKGGLDHEVQEGGDNFSVGQRQLFCVARAFLRNSKILIMDEATASVDYDTHRISTILNSDRIVVLSEGKIVEHDSPKALLSKSSVFASLVQANK